MKLCRQIIGLVISRLQKLLYVDFANGRKKNSSILVPGLKHTMYTQFVHTFDLDHSLKVLAERTICIVVYSVLVHSLTIHYEQQVCIE